MTIFLPNGRFIFIALYIIVMTQFMDMYAEYLERMYADSMDLTAVDKLTVPKDVDPDSPELIEWADIY